jgi:hypothetical protein
MQFTYFLINGLILGFFTFILQYILDLKLKNFFNYHQLISSILTIMPFMFINFMSQKKIIFKKNGSFAKFILSSLFIMFMISITNEFFNRFNFFNYNTINLNFMFSAIIYAPLSFLIKKNIIFNR